MIKINVFFLGLTILCLYGCNNIGPDSIDDYKPIYEEIKYYEYSKSTFFRFMNPGHLEGIVDYNVNGEEFIVEWAAYKSDRSPIVFSLPKEWVIHESMGKKIKSFLPDGKGSFTFMIHEKKDYGNINLDDYLTFLIHDIKTDTSKNLEFLRQEELLFNRQSGHFIVVSNGDKENNNLYLIVISESEKFIFDFTLKMKKDGVNEANRASFWPIVNSFKIGGNSIIPSGESIYKIQFE